MKHVFTIAGKEFRSALNSPVAYLFIAIFFAASWGLFFKVEKFFARDEASLRGFFDWVPWLLWGLGPPLTMRLWADERRLGTWEVLSTTPLKTTELVLGKFFGAFGLLATALLFTIALPVVVANYGNLDIGPVIGGYVASLLLGAAYLAIGLVCSACAQDQLVALVLGWAVGLLGMLPGFPFWENLAGRAVANGLRGFGFGPHFESIGRGLLDARDLVFFLSVIVAALTANVALVRWRRISA